MSFIVESGGNFERCPTGAHLARCYRIVDLGTQKSEYMGEVKHLHKIMLGWEVHGVDDNGKPLTTKDGRPFAMFKNYTLSWSEKANLRLDLQSWRGKAFDQEEMRKFDLKTVLGAWCMLNVIERPGTNGNIYANVNGVTPVPAIIKQSGLPKAVNPDELFNLQEPDMAIFANFSDNLKAKITSSPQWKEAHGEISSAKKTEHYVSADPDDSIPF